MDSDECCAHGNILTTICLRKQPCQDNHFFRRYDSMPHYMRSHQSKLSKNPFRYVMSTQQLRFNCIFNNSSPLTLRLFITCDRYSTVFTLTKSEERLENLSKQLHHVYFRQRKNDVTGRHILLKLVCFATVVPLFER